MTKSKNQRQRFEKVDPTPVAIPVGFHRPPTLAEQVARLVKSERWNYEMARQGHETFEEANDFDIDDEFGGVDRSIPFEDGSPYEEKYQGQFEDEVRMESRHFEQSGKVRTRKASPPRQGKQAGKEAKKDDDAPEGSSSARKQASKQVDSKEDDRE